MTSMIEPFECHWRPSRLLLGGYLLVAALASLSIMLAELPGRWQVILLMLLLLHTTWVLPRQLLMRHAGATSGLRHDADGWQLYSERDGWQAAQLYPDSLALPSAIFLQFRLKDQRWRRGLCIACDALPAAQHRRLRVRLKFSRRRWAAPE
ncbi:toxin CptA [Pseudomonas fluvialis]|uniref:Toxin CptA n=1 Tax=Pseudomonas fluvialis TaxID=1793966 RepID=A0A7X0ESC4_9PSED|nr:protein YgfX [Pseudomonas fluvialis]MBB6342138.1 toxin CptA [Pseudomonas fluvialis]